ncbi:hypothetical protein MKW92_039210 [Papaver armeniacum]|nr:hypothetical protein MKW92_039210 [Papaver armeniacum]
MQNLIWLRRPRKRSLIWLRKSIKRSLIFIRESVELDQQEVAADASLRNDPIVLAPESITFFAEGISLTIPSRQAQLQMSIPNFGKNRFNGTAECLRRKSDKFKQQIVKVMARRIIAFFIYLYIFLCNSEQGTDILLKLHQDFLPGKHKVIKELGETLCWTGKDHKDKLRKDEELELIRAHKANRDRKISRRRSLKFRAYFA